MTDAEGKIIWKGKMSLWGKTLRESYDHETYSKHASEQNLRFQGQYFDRETGLHYNTFRYYDPIIGRFTQPDPIDLAGGINLYQYAPNPIGWVDPWGLVKTCGSHRDKITRGQNNEILSVEGRILPSDIGTGTNTNGSSRSWTRNLGLSTDDAGHTRGNNLGGSGGKKFVFPQNPHINRGQFQVFEGKIANYVTTNNTPVTFRQTFNYGNGGTRPTTINYDVYDKGSLIFSQIFSN